MWRRRLDLNERRECFIDDAARTRERTMNRAMKLLAAKPRSVRELTERLLEKNWTNETIVDDVIERLKEFKYLDDEQFSREVAVTKLKQKPQGRRRLRQAMFRKKLDSETLENAIEAAFEKYPEEKLIDAAIEKRLRLRDVPETREETKKLYDHLLRLGFDHDLIRSKISHLTERTPT